MSIQVSNVTKVYGEQKALDDVSFQVNKGEILGFLGPNGAGKSTIMKIITTFIPPSEGTVSVCGFDILTQSMDVRKNVGYLPENNPLYLDMYVKEYLGFIAGLHKISGKQKRIEEMIGLTGLEREQHKKIGALSKGYRQRVGLAQALIHNPDVIILDEPTSGLDPNQLADIRELIRAIGKEKTLMFSTHIMQEVEAICDRVIIINRGKIVADGKADELSRQQKRGFTIEVEFDKAFDINILKKISGVKKVRTMKDFSFELVYEGEADIRPEIFKLAVEHQATVLTINRKELKLEEVFQQLTK
ncbi:MAG: gliding motility-associated ABC transporter ATP-binding subunit GldA [Bacteroidia bacterium]